MKKILLGACVAFACIASANAGMIADAQRADAAANATWSAWGGNVGVYWNTDLLGNLGVSLQSPERMIAAPVTGTHADFRPHTWFSVRQSGGLEFAVYNGTLRGFNAGSLAVDGGFVMKLRDQSTLDLRNLTLRVRPGNNMVLDVVSADGKAWFYSDRIMFQLADNDRTLAIRAADLRISKELANRLGAPESAGWEIADLALNTQVYIQGKDLQPEEACAPYPWPQVAVPGEPGQIYQADLFMQALSTSPVGCENCTGPNGQGIASIAPNSTLRNNVNDGSLQQTINDPLGTSSALHTGFVAWHTMFSGNSAPYNNDQHPFLIWNVYRLNANGGIEQVGRSAVKHAFVTTNGGCLDGCNHLGGAALGRGCNDTYGVGNNDSPGDMGPRSEIIPATGQWGRCGSIFDPDCNGSENNNGNDSWTQRMKIPEGRLKHSNGDGVGFLFESWYVAREDINIYNSMATLSVNPQFAGSQWSLAGASNYRLGPAIDRWVDPVAPPAGSMNSALATSEGHVKVAVKVTALGNGRWRYNYAVMNLDFARAVTEGAEPNLRVTSNSGFDGFSVPVGSAQVTTTTTSSGELNPNMAWRARVAANRATWNTDLTIPGLVSGAYPAPTALPTLDWGVLYAFSFVATAAPVAGDATLHVAQSGSPSSYGVATLVPGATAATRR